MATYKKRGSKSKDKRAQQAAGDKSATAEVFNTLDETASRSEKWIEKNNKPLFYGLVAIIVIILGYMGYNKYIVEPTEIEATNKLDFPRKYFDEAKTTIGANIDSLLNLGLKGADGEYGFIDISATYGGTKAGNMANYYAGISYLKMKDYENAIKYLSKFKSNDKILTPTALGAIGDAFADINQLKEAIDYYEKAANKNKNEFTTPLFLLKAGKLAMELKEFSKAEKFFSIIKEDYPSTDFGRDIDKYISIAKYAQ